MNLLGTLVTILVISILASLSVPAVSRAYSWSKTTIHKSHNLSQMRLDAQLRAMDNPGKAIFDRTADQFAVMSVSEVY